MKFSKLWLDEWLSKPVLTTELVSMLTMAGLEVESCSPVAGEFSGVIVAHVVAVDKHPDADRLRVCQVDPGHGQDHITVVCGASNVRAGLKVALATVGAQLPGGLLIKRSKLRGVESCGMICSQSELTLEKTSEGIMELPEDAPVGEDIRKYLLLDDVVIDLALTPNRGDCLSILGVAREVASLTGTALQESCLRLGTPTALAATEKVDIKVNVHAAEACPRYMGRVLRNINGRAATPMWMIERLSRAGIRHLTPVVDVCNYVMLELGQPLHAFDLETITGDVQVRMAKAKESLELLNGQTVQLQPQTLVIADEKNILAMAGIMGGSDSAVTTETKHIFLESAHFAPKAMIGQARGYGLQTDASYRFERGVDPQLPERAMARATELLLAIVGGEVCEIICEEAQQFIVKPKEIKLRLLRVERVLGIAFAEETVADIFKKLDFKFTRATKDQEVIFTVTVPSFRFDISEEIDLIEEIARIYGYQTIPMHAPKAGVASPLTSELVLTPTRVRTCFVDRGYQEAITYSFVDEHLQQLLDPGAQVMKLLNPISADMSVMRTTLWAGLLAAVSHNQNRQQPRVRLFELGLRFRTVHDELVQEPVIAGVATMTASPEQWGETDRKLDFYDVKADLQALFSLSQTEALFDFSRSSHPALHPGQSAEVHRQGKLVGYIGALHPDLQRKLDLQGPVYLFELSLGELSAAHLPVYQPVAKFPSIRRDLAFVVKESATAEAIAEAIKRAAGRLLIDLFVFDVYQGKHIEAGKKSVAVGLVLQNPKSTLIDSEVNEIISKVIDTLKTELEAHIRE